MTVLSMAYNKFTGQIPSSMQNLTKLVAIFLHDNMLSGEIPTWFLEFRSLKALHIGGKGSNFIWNNNAKILPRCNLVELSMPYCGISGQIPEWVSSHNDLVFLDLIGNQLEGRLPDWLAERNFEVISLSGNNLSGSIPSRIFDNTHLLFLDFSQNNFSGELPPNIGNAKSVNAIVLSENNFSGQLPSSISMIDTLEYLDLSKNRFFGDNLHALGDKSNLILLDLSYNNFSCNIPSKFPKWIQRLYLGGNKFSGNLPWNLNKLFNLQLLDIHGNNITGNFHSTLPQIPALRILILRNNSLEGHIPSNISNLRYLQILDLSYNNLTGSIPKEISNIVGMILSPNISTSPRISHSVIDSTFEPGELTVLWKKSFHCIAARHIISYSLLDLSYNRIYGEIPPSLGKLKALKLLNVAHNKIFGHIPVSFGDLENLESLDLSHNEISGSIPQSLVKLGQLTVLDVSNNKLTGKIPVGGQMTTMDELSYFENNSGLCGMQIRVTCPEDIPTIEGRDKEEEDEKRSWFSWEGTWVGFPVGFFSSILIMGYFLDFLRLFKIW
ncbi:putative non-specific serine/threonine protein kinase [Helianthus annuus]|nr:putative non-specific serine/threonine protein kinase [Helianthus annuus]